MAQRLQEFCALLVDEYVGAVCSQIFVHLSEQGRMSRLQLQQLTRLPGRQLRHALTVMTQQHILRYHTDDAEITRYSIDWRGAYSLIRSNRIISIVDERYGEVAAKIITNLLQLGHARIGDLAQAFDFEPASKASDRIDACHEHVNGAAKTNGTDISHTSKSHGANTTTVGNFHTTLRTLLQAGFLVKLQKRAYMPAADLQDEIEEIVKQGFLDGKIAGKNKQNQFRRDVNELKRKWQNEDQYVDRHESDTLGSIRSAVASHAKRTKLSGDRSNGVGHGNGDLDEHVPKLPNEMVVRVNYAQCILALRSQRLEQLAVPYLGQITATVYGALLRAIEGKVKACDGVLGRQKDDDDDDDDDDNDGSPTATNADVVAMLESNLDLSLGVHDPTRKKRPTGTYKRNEAFDDLEIKEEIFSDDDETNGQHSFENQTKHRSLVDDHLRILAEHPKGFCKRVGGAGHGEWRVPFPSLTSMLVQAEIDSTILARHGKVHMRIVRLLRERGRLEEKQIATLTMMRIKDVRAILTQLQYAGFAESQEVPRDNSRMATRTTYLWFHDQARVQNLLLQQTYQGMSRALQRLEQERENYKNAIEKAEMLDVKQDSLNQTEKQAVQQWREVEERLVIQVQRMDELVALLRDFSGKDTSLVS